MNRKIIDNPLGENVESEIQHQIMTKTMSAFVWLYTIIFPVQRPLFFFQHLLFLFFATSTLQHPPLVQRSAIMQHRPGATT